MGLFIRPIKAWKCSTCVDWWKLCAGQPSEGISKLIVVFQWHDILIGCAMGTQQKRMCDKWVIFVLLTSSYRCQYHRNSSDRILVTYLTVGSKISNSPVMFYSSLQPVYWKWWWMYHCFRHTLYLCLMVLQLFHCFDILRGIKMANNGCKYLILMNMELQLEKKCAATQYGRAVTKILYDARLAMEWAIYLEP